MGRGGSFSFVLHGTGSSAVCLRLCVCERDVFVCMCVCDYVCESEREMSLRVCVFVIMCVCEREREMSLRVCVCVIMCV